MSSEKMFHAVDSQRLERNAPGLRIYLGNTRMEPFSQKQKLL